MRRFGRKRIYATVLGIPLKPMSEITINDVLALNNELAALATAGIPTSVLPGISTETIPDALDRINNSLALRSSLGQSLVAATSENQDIPPIYRSALEVGLRCNCLSATLDGISRQAAAKHEIHRTIARSLISPLILFVLGYFGFMLLCLDFSPTIESIYDQSNQPYSGSVRFLITLREWLPYWAVMVPVLVFVAAFSLLRGSASWQSIVPGAQKYATSIRYANFARQLALLLESNVPLSESLPLAAAVSGGEGLIASSRELSQSLARGDIASENGEKLRGFPPFLRWALTGDLGGQTLAEILRFAEKTYQHLAERRAYVLRYVLPTIVGALLGGSIVLVYGLSVFGPFVRLLKDLSA